MDSGSLRLRAAGAHTGRKRRRQRMLAYCMGLGTRLMKKTIDRVLVEEVVQNILDRTDRLCTGPAKYGDYLRAVSDRTRALLNEHWDRMREEEGM